MPNGHADHNDIYEAIGRLQAQVDILSRDVEQIKDGLTTLNAWFNKSRGGLIVLSAIITGLGVLGGVIFGIFEALK